MNINNSTQNAHQKARKKEQLKMNVQSSGPRVLAKIKIEGKIGSHT